MLGEKLKEMRAASAAKIAPETLAIMKRAKEKLAASGILEQTIKVGEPFPHADLQDSTGRLIDFSALRQKGPVLMTIYRGVW